MVLETVAASIRPYNSAKTTRVISPLLVSALFLQRFTIPFGKSFVSLDFVPTAFICCTNSFLENC